jgi:amino acid transporter
VHTSRILTLFPGAVLTAFIGVNGLVRRLALDRSLPAFLLETNSLRGTNHWIALMFLILKGEVGSLANVYSLSFLLVMALFAFGCMMLKFKRSDLKRDVRATWTQVVYFAGFLCFVDESRDRFILGCHRHFRRHFGSHWEHLLRP